ncbi:hypothetical protein TNCV_2654961 [Trichonephila clavipes]|nr:hypothetical protein TNCV_2654961 [Trichonephila clavipes]
MARAATRFKSVEIIGVKISVPNGVRTKTKNAGCRYASLINQFLEVWKRPTQEGRFERIFFVSFYSLRTRERGCGVSRTSRKELRRPLKRRSDSAPVNDPGGYQRKGLEGEDLRTFSPAKMNVNNNENLH